MSDCWNCDEVQGGYNNYCTQCGMPQKPSMAAQSFHRSANDFKRGLDGLLDLLDGCPEMLAEGLAETEGYDEIGVSEWERRFENSIRWINGCFSLFCMMHYDLSQSDLEDLGEELEEPKDETDSLPAPANQMCGCGGSLPSEAPSIITQWKEATEVSSVCFECFGQISSRITVIE